VKLGDAGLADIDVDDRADTPIPPKRATLTDDGVQKAKEWDLDLIQRTSVLQKIGFSAWSAD